MELELGYFGKWIINTWKVFKCGSGEYRDQLGRSCVKKEYYKKSRRRGTSYVQ